MIIDYLQLMSSGRRVESRQQAVSEFYRALKLGIQLQHIRKGTMREEDWTRLAATMGRITDAPLFIDDSPNMSLMEIRAKCRRLKQICPFSPFRPRRDDLG